MRRWMDEDPPWTADLAWTPREMVKVALSTLFLSLCLVGLIFAVSWIPA